MTQTRNRKSTKLAAGAASELTVDLPRFLEDESTILLSGQFEQVGRLVNKTLVRLYFVLLRVLCLVQVYTGLWTEIVTPDFD